jgi:hypothetical protein
MLPDRQLQRGDRVELITVPPASGTSTPVPSVTGSLATRSAGSGSSAVARMAEVDAESSPAQDGTVIVDVVVSADDAPGVAADGAAGRLSLVLLPRSSS